MTLFDFAVTTIFAREFLEGAIIIGEYRTIIIRGESLAPGIEKNDALRAITLASLVATALALCVIAAIAIPLAILSNTFDATTSNIIEGLSKIVAAISLMQLSLKLPKWLGVYGSRKKRDHGENEDGLTLRSIRFNVAWNIWREVAECGVFLIPFFLSGEGLEMIPLSAVIGSFVGLALGVALYFANKRMTNKLGLAVFGVLVLVFLAVGLFAGGCHKLETEIGLTKTVWTIEGDFWSVNRLPMTVLKPFGYNDSRTVLEIVSYWSALLLAGLLHYRKYRISPKIGEQSTQEDLGEVPEVPKTRSTSSLDSSDLENVEMGHDDNKDSGEEPKTSSLSSLDTDDLENVEIGEESTEEFGEEPRGSSTSFLVGWKLENVEIGQSPLQDSTVEISMTPVEDLQD